MAIMETVIEIPMEHEKNIFGSFDSNIKKIERSLNVTMVARDGNLKLVGEAGNVRQAEGILMQLLELSRRGNTCIFFRLPSEKTNSSFVSFVYRNSFSSISSSSFSRRPAEAR